MKLKNIRESSPRRPLLSLSLSTHSNSFESPRMHPLSIYDQEDRSTSNNTPPSNNQDHIQESEKLSVINETQRDLPPNYPSIQQLKRNPRRLGRTYAFCYNKDGDPRIVIGPNIGFFICLSSFIFAITIAMLVWVSVLGYFWLLGIGILSLFIQTLNYLLVVLSNPGIPSRKYTRMRIKAESEQSPDRQFNPADSFCTACGLYRRAGTKAIHCSDCGVCIEGLDHHCPWMTKCVGRKTKLFFYLFILTTLVHMGYVILALFFGLKSIGS